MILAFFPCVLDSRTTALNRNDSAGTVYVAHLRVRIVCHDAIAGNLLPRNKSLRGSQEGGRTPNNRIGGPCVRKQLV